MQDGIMDSLDTKRNDDKSRLFPSDSDINYSPGQRNVGGWSVSLPALAAP